MSGASDKAVVACNTASAYALDTLEEASDIPIIGVVKPGARVAADVTRNGRIGVIATEATIGSRMYSKYIQSISSNVTIYGKACPLFVPLVEEGLLEDPVTDEIARRYLAELIDIDIDTLILGCTHYPVLEGAISRVAGDGVRLINPGVAVSKAVADYIKNAGLQNSGENKGDHKFYVSDKPDSFKNLASVLLGEELDDGRVEQVDLNDL